MKMEDYNLNMNDACEILGYKKSTLYVKVNKGEIKYKKFGKFLRFSGGDLSEYKKNNTK